MKHWGICEFGIWRDWGVWKHNGNKYILLAALLLSLFASGSGNQDRPKAEREVVYHTRDASLCRKHQIYSHSRQTGCITAHHPPSLYPFKWISDALPEATQHCAHKQSGCHMHSSHTEASPQPKAQVPYFTIPPLVAGHVAIPYLL